MIPTERGRLRSAAVTSWRRRGLIWCTVFAVFAALQTTQAESQEQASAAGLTETHWTLVELDGAATGGSAGAAPYIYLQRPGDKLSGSGGCNRLFGSFDLSGSSLEFHSVAATLMACPNDAGKFEAELLAALKLTSSYAVTGSVLELRVGERVLARFQAAK